MFLGIQKFRDAKVEQLRDAVLRDQNVGGLQVAMNDEMLMRVVNRGADLLNECQTRRRGELIAIAVVIDPQPFDILHGDERSSVGRVTAIEQARDVGMIEPRQDLPFGAKARSQIGMEQTTCDDFQSDLLLILIVRALGEIDGAHAAVTEQSRDFETADDLADRQIGSMKHRCDRSFHLPLESSVLIVSPQHGEHFIFERRLLAALGIEKLQACILSQVDGGFEELLKLLPVLRGHQGTLGDDPVLSALQFSCERHLQA